jgi:hypothetical protein
MAEERGKHRRGDIVELHNTSDDDFRQRIDVPGSGIELRRDGDEQRGDTDGECDRGSTDDHHAASKPDGDGGADGDVHSSRHRHVPSDLSMDEERNRDQWCNFVFLYNTGDNEFG